MAGAKYISQLTSKCENLSGPAITGAATKPSCRIRKLHAVYFSDLPKQVRCVEPSVLRFDAAGVGGGSIRVMPRLIANSVTAVSSVSAETGRIIHAALRFASYAGTSDATRSRQPRFKTAREAPMSPLL